MPSSVFFCKKKTQKHIKHMGSWTCLICSFNKNTKNTKNPYITLCFFLIYSCMFAKKNTKTRKIHHLFKFFYTCMFATKKHINTQNTWSLLIFLNKSWKKHKNTQNTKNTFGHFLPFNEPYLRKHIKYVNYFKYGTLKIVCDALKYVNTSNTSNT